MEATTVLVTNPPTGDRTLVVRVNGDDNVASTENHQLQRLIADDSAPGQGTLTFKRPIVAVVTHEPVRFAKFVGHPATEYQRDMETGLEDAVDDDASRADGISISEDLRSLTLRLNITGLDRSETPDDINQFRVLIESSED